MRVTDKSDYVACRFVEYSEGGLCGMWDTKESYYMACGTLRSGTMWHVDTETLDNVACGTLSSRTMWHVGHLEKKSDYVGH